MRRSPEGFAPPVDTQKSGNVSRRASVVERSHEAALLGESFEDAAAAVETIEAFADVRKQLHERKFPSFYQLFEDIDAVNHSSLSDTEKDEERNRLLDAAEGRIGAFSPRVADLHLAIIAELCGHVYEPRFEENQRKLSDLKESGDLDVLVSETQSWEVKLNRLDTRFDGYLAGRRALDRREGNLMDDDTRMVRQQKLKGAPKNPPERRNESKPGMDEMERLKEGERVPALWSIFPAYGGYYREQSLSVWDATRNTWVEPSYEYKEVQFVPKCEKEDAKKGLLNLNVRSQLVANQWVNVPTPYTHGVSRVECHGKYFLQQDHNGDVVIMVEGEGVVDVNIILSPVSEKTYGPVGRTKAKVPEMPARFSEGTQEEIKKVRSTKKETIIQARALASYTRRHLNYSNDSSFNAIYDTDPQGYFGAIDERRQADCDVANTYFAALCAQLNIPVRHVVGHSVKGKNVAGNSEINSGTGHAWSEEWDNMTGRWARVDATPPGDQNLEEEQLKGPNQKVPGDYGEQEAQSITDEQLEALRKKLAERKEQLSYTKEERDLTKATGIEMKEARQIVREINKADQTRLAKGEKVVDVLSEVFTSIIRHRKNIVPAYEGPMRKNEGGEAITHMVPHVLGSMAGDVDPASREKSIEKKDIQKTFAGFDVYIIADKSGSMMASTAEGESLWKMQRRAAYLILSSLHRFEKNIESAHLPYENALSVRTEGISFRGSAPDEIDEDKPLSGAFIAADKVKYWHSLTNQGGGNGDVAALTYIYEQIKKELESEKKQNKKDSRLRLVFACSDGGPDNPVLVQQLAEELGKLNAVVVGIGLTETARSVPEIYNTPYSRGDIAESIDDLPAIMAKHVVMEASKLFHPEDKAATQEELQKVLQKFS